MELPGDGHRHGMWLSAEQRPRLIRRSARATRWSADGPATVQIRAICASLTHPLGSPTLCRADERVPGDGVLPVILRPRDPLMWLLGAARSNVRSSILDHDGQNRG